MKLVKYRVVVAAVVAAMAIMVGAGSAQAAFPDFTGCTSRMAETGLCIDIQARSGNLRIRDFNVPLHESLAIRGILIPNGTSEPLFTAPAGTTGLFARPEPVPGGLLGIEWLPGNSVLAITELAGPPSAIRINLNTGSVRMPVKVRLENLALGMNCKIGSNTNPINLNLIIGTTNPPPPNTPITGRAAPLTPIPGGFAFLGVVNVDNTFAVPGANSCGLGLGLINTLVNLKLGLPSPAGYNSMEVTNDLAVGFVP